MTKPDSLQLLIFAFPVILLMGCSGESSPSKSSDQHEKVDTVAEQSPTNDESTGENTVPAIDVEALRKQFAYVKPQPLGEPAASFTLEEFTKDGEANVEKYRDKCIEISGRIVNFGFSDQAILNRHPESTYFVVQCGTENTEFAIMRFFEGQPWMSCTLGDTVTVRGNVYESLGDSVIMTHCELIESPGDPVPILTKDLYQVAKDTGEEFDISTFKDKAFRIVGTVSAAEETGFNDGVITLSSHEGFNVLLKVDWFDWQHIKVGDEITTLGLGADFYFEEGQLELGGLPPRVDIFK